MGGWRSISFCAMIAALDKRTEARYISVSSSFGRAILNRVSMHKPTTFQAEAQRRVAAGESLLLIAPTGVGKTFAVTGDLRDSSQKVVYSVPLRSLGYGIRDEVADYCRGNPAMDIVIHHGDTQESNLFCERLIVTTFDQVVCAVPGLPLSLPLRAGHAIAGAIMMSRLILDEVHLAWSISEKSLAILLAICKQRRQLGLQTVFMSATLPDAVVGALSPLFDSTMILGTNGTESDEGLLKRDQNREVQVSTLTLRSTGKKDSKAVSFSPLYDTLATSADKAIYFANTVRRLHSVYDALLAHGVDPDRITMLHNRMPRVWRQAAEQEAMDRFGPDDRKGRWLLLTNQVAEAGLNLSAGLVITDPAPVDTLVQRAGRCARWFRARKTRGTFLVLSPPKAALTDPKAGFSSPYKPESVGRAVSSLPSDTILTWETERRWVNAAWAETERKATTAIERSLADSVFALNLFDRAAQFHNPGQIASAFRDVLTVEVAVETRESRELDCFIAEGLLPQTSSVSLAYGIRLFGGARDAVRLLSQSRDATEIIDSPDTIRTGDIILVRAPTAYLHRKKGLCFAEEQEQIPQPEGADWLVTDWIAPRDTKGRGPWNAPRRQTLEQHVVAVMRRTAARLLRDDSEYRCTLNRILVALEPDTGAEQLANAVGAIAILAAALHDIGKADREWQAQARSIDPACEPGLIGRTQRRGRITRWHTPPAYNATLKAAELLLGLNPRIEYLIKAVALAGTRHHSSLMNPATTGEYTYSPADGTEEFLVGVLHECNAPVHAIQRVGEIISAATQRPSARDVPHLLPTDPTFAIYALVGRAILISDREDAAGYDFESSTGTHD